MAKRFLIIHFLFILTFHSGMLFSQVHEGDTVQFWSVSYIDWPPLWGSPQRTITAVCKKEGRHCKIMVETTAVQPSGSSIDSMANLFDDVFYPRLTSKYGPVPDALDNDSSVYILALEEYDWAGYFDPGQQMPDSVIFAGWSRHSSQREIIYIASQYFETSAPGIIAHEFGHLLHWGCDHSPEPPASPRIFWEDAFVDEGFSTFAAIYLTEDIFMRGVMDYSAFFCYDPDIPLIWFSNYNQVELFTLYMFEHYGNWSYITELINNQLNGIDGINSTLENLGYSERFDDVFQQWTIADFIDDSVYEAGKYQYSHYDFPPCRMARYHASMPVTTQWGTVSAYGTDYIAFIPALTGPFSVDFEGESGKKFRVAFIEQDTVNGITVNVENIQIDPLNQGSFFADSAGISYNRLVMVVSCTDSTVHSGESASYSYSISMNAVITDPPYQKAMHLFPDPVENVIFIDFSGNSLLSGDYSIFDYTGKCMAAGTTIDGSINTSSLRSGFYVLILQTLKGVYKGKFIKS